MAAKPGITPREVLPADARGHAALRRVPGVWRRSCRTRCSWTPTSTKPSAHPGEKDGTFLQALWERASQGGTPEEMEKAVASDSYRIRRVLAHWVEQGALKIRAAG